MHHLWLMHHLGILMFAYLILLFAYSGSGVAMSVAARNSGSWQRVSDGRMLVFRSPWTLTVSGTMIAVPMIAISMFLAVVLIHSPGDPPVPLWVLIWLASFWGEGLLLLVWLSPQELQIDQQGKTYRYTRPWLTPWRKGAFRPLADFSGVCATPLGGLLLVFHKRRGLLIGCALGMFAKRAQAQEQAPKFSEMIGLPIVEAPGRKGRWFAA